jgi:hypothetical protein
MADKTPPASDAVTYDSYVLDVLMRDLVGHDRSPSAFVTYVHLWRQSFGRGEASVTMSLREIAEATGLSRRGVQDALGALARRELIGIQRKGITDIPTYTVRRPWRR